MGVIFLLIGFFAITLIAAGLQKVALIALAYGVPLGLVLLYWCLRRGNIRISYPIRMQFGKTRMADKPQPQPTRGGEP